MADFQSYFSIIPGRVRCDDSLSPNAKLLFGEISSLANQSGYAYARNAHFAAILGVSERTVRRMLEQLVAAGHIKVRIVRDAETGQVTGRQIYPIFDVSVPEDGATDSGKDAPEKCENPVDKFDHWPVDKNVHPSGQKCPLDNNVEEEIIIKKPPISPKKKQGDEEARAAAMNWLRNLEAEDESQWEKLEISLVGFFDSRIEKKKPMRTVRCAVLLCNRLEKYSGGSVEVMISMLDDAVLHGWDSVYPPRDTQQAKQQEGGADRWI